MKKKMLALFVTGAVILAGGCGSAESVQQEQQTDVADREDAAAGDTASQPEDGSAQDGAASQPQDDGPQSADGGSQPGDGGSQSADGGAQSEDGNQDGNVASQPEDGNTADGSAPSQDTDKADMDGLSDVLESVYSAAPGTAGSSLKSVIAAGAILDWAEDNYALSSGEEIKSAVSDWRAKKKESAGDVYSDGDMLDALAGVDADAKLIMSDRAGMAELLEDSGTVLSHEQYTAERYQAVADIFVSSFTK